MKYYLLLFFALFFGNKGFAQDSTSIVEWTQQLKIAKEDTNKINLLLDLAWELQFADRPKALQYSIQAYNLSVSFEYPKGIGDSQVRLGNLARNIGDYPKAEKHFQDALPIRMKLKDWPGVASIYNNMGLNAFYQGQIEKAKDFYQQGLEIMTNKPDHPILTNLENGLADVFLRLGNHNKAINEIEKCIRICEKLKLDHQKAAALLNLGIIYQDLQNFRKSKEYYLESLDLSKKSSNKNGEAKCYINLGALTLTSRDYESALNYLQNALELKNDIDQNDIGILYKNIGTTHLQLKQFDKAIPSLLLSLETNKKLNNPLEIATVSYNLGKTYFDQSNYTEALEYYENSHQILDTIPNTFLKTNVLFNLSETYARLGDYEKAFQYGNQTTTFQDSLNQKNIESINNERNLLEKQNQIEILKKDQTLKKTIIGSLIGLFILSLMLTVAIFQAYRNRQKKTIAEKDAALAKQKVIELEDKKALAEKDAQIFKQEVIEVLKEQELKAHYARLEGQEKERTRVAKDLHDRLGSMLSTVKLYFKELDTPSLQQEKDRYKQFHQANTLLDKAADEVRQIAHNMVSGVLATFGLEQELNDLSQTFDGSQKLQVKITTHGLKDRLNNTLEVKVYRIIQELLNNVIKHANASNLVIQLNRFKEVLNILVEDNGIGFDLELAKKQGGMGMKNLESRINDLKGSLLIDSGKGHGTTISIDIPLV